MSSIKEIKNAKSYLGKRGYILRKKFLNDEQINNIRSDLNVKPFVNGDYGGVEESFKIYNENENKLYLPKFYGIEKFGKPEVNILPQGKDINIDFSLDLKDEQKIPAEKTIEAYEQHGGGILSLPCGFGKTILALYFISILKKKTLVIVHKEFLMNQWIERIKFALPNAKVGIVQGDKCQIDDNDIIIGMLQTLSMKEFAQDTFDDIGHVIIDECHTISSRVFSRALMKVNSKYMLGISATPTRSDGLMKVLKYHIGDTFFTIKSNEKNIVKVERYLLDSTNENYNQDIINFRGQVVMATMINNIADCRDRTNLIINKAISEINAHEKRQILILSDRRQQLEDMYKIITQTTNISVGYYIGGLKKGVLKDNEKCKILLGTYPMASTGLDIPSLNGLILATPRSDIIQSIGRIDRIVHTDIQPLIVDIVDIFSVFESQSRKRFAVYKKKKYMIEDISYNLDKNVVIMSKNYFFHNIAIKDDSDEIDDNEGNDREEKNEVDINYDDIDPKTNKKKKNIKKNEKKISKEHQDIEDLFKSFSFFKKS
jgi:superfamily II DNA or RNA helicase